MNKRNQLFFLFQMEKMLVSLLLTLNFKSKGKRLLFANC